MQFFFIRSRKSRNYFFVYLQCYLRYREVRYLILILETKCFDHQMCDISLRAIVLEKNATPILYCSYFSSKLFNLCFFYNLGCHQTKVRNYLVYVMQNKILRPVLTFFFNFVMVTTSKVLVDIKSLACTN